MVRRSCRIVNVLRSGAACFDLMCVSPAESRKSMTWRYYELLWLIHHHGPFLSRNQADASLASLRNFFRGQKQNGLQRLSFGQYLCF